MPSIKLGRIDMTLKVGENKVLYKPKACAWSPGGPQNKLFLGTVIPQLSPAALVHG